MQFVPPIKLKQRANFPPELKTVEDARRFIDAHVKTLPANPDDLHWLTAGRAIEASQNEHHIRKSISHALRTEGWLVEEE